MQRATRRYRADLHVHTALSPCASAAMTPPAILAAAVERKIDLIGALDHNGAANARSLVDAAAGGAAGGAVRVLPGLEVQSMEGIHIVCLCDDPGDAEEMQDFVCAHLPEAANPSEIARRQRLLNADGEQVGQENRALWQPTRLTLVEICREAHRRGFLVIPAHVTRQGTGLIEVLGRAPEGLEIDALESDPHMATSARVDADLARYPWVVSSDAHQPDEIGMACTDFWLREPTVAELRLALRGESGRRAWGCVTNTAAKSWSG